MMHIGAIYGGPELTGSSVDAALGRLLQRRGASPQDDLASLDIVFHVAGSLLAPEFEGIRTGSFSRKNRILQVQIAVPASIVASSDPYPFLAARICEAVRLARPVFDKAGINYPEDEYAALAGRLADMEVH